MASRLSTLCHLRARGLVKTVTGEFNKPVLYCGVDPTARSLHLGNLLTLIPLLHYDLAGCDTFTLVGGATGQIGDPTDRKEERKRTENIESNVKSLISQLARFIENGRLYARTYGYSSHGTHKTVNNADWFNDLSFLSFINDIGRHVRINQMLARDSVKQRLAAGMSFSEFTYQLLQAYDYHHLNNTYNVNLQIGGSDQYGNITAGIDLIQRLGGEAFGLTVPLLLTSSGAKFGKSAGNAIWLDATMTSPYDLYQYLLNTEDVDVDRYTKMFTLRPLEECGSQATLASEVLHLIHGETIRDETVHLTQLLFANDRAVIDLMPPHTTSSDLLGILVETGLSSSRKDSRRLIDSGGLYCWNERVTSYTVPCSPMLLRKGKNKFVLVNHVP